MFKLAKLENGRINVGEPEYLTVEANVKAGQALNLDGGVLKRATGATKPTHIAGANATANSTIPALRVEGNQIYRAPMTGDEFSERKVGDKVTISTNSDGVTTTTTSGVATIVSFGEAEASGDHILVRFA